MSYLDGHLAQNSKDLKRIKGDASQRIGKTRLKLQAAMDPLYFLSCSSNMCSPAFRQSMPRNAASHRSCVALVVLIFKPELRCIGTLHTKAGVALHKKIALYGVRLHLRRRVRKNTVGKRRHSLSVLRYKSKNFILEECPLTHC